MVMKSDIPVSVRLVIESPRNPIKQWSKALKLHHKVPELLFIRIPKGLFISSITLTHSLKTFEKQSKVFFMDKK